jgi:hypothetical protein
MVILKDRFSLIPLGLGVGGLVLGIAFSSYSLGNIENVNIELLRKRAINLAEICYNNEL